MLQLFSHRVSITHLRMFRLGRISDNWQCSGFFSYIAPHIGSGSYPGSPYILDRYSSGERTSLLCTDVRLEYKSEGRPGVILGSPCSLFSESTGLEFHTCIILVEFCLFRSAATCYGMRQSSVYSLRVEALDHVVGWLVLSFAVSPGTWPGGAWVPGGPRPCFSLLLLFHDPNFVFRNFSPGCLTFHSAQRAPPQFENHVQIFHLSSTDDERTGPGYMDQLACEQKKSYFTFRFSYLKPHLVSTSCHLQGFIMQLLLCTSLGPTVV